MYLNYKDGKLNSVTISATVYITGPGIKDAKEGNAMANNLTKEAANTFIDSKNVTFDVNYKYKPSVDANKLGAGENVLNFSDKKMVKQMVKLIHQQVMISFQWQAIQELYMQTIKT